MALAQSTDGLLALQPKDAAAARHIALQRQAYALINRAGAHVSATRPACRPRRPARPSTPTARDRARLLGLVPDGVASVTLEYPRTVNRGRDYKPTV